MPTDTQVEHVIINKLTNEQYASATKNPTELYLTPDGEGSFSDLVLATDVGKKALAQRLTEKGVSSTPSDTLLEMADKLNGLSINNEQTRIVSKLCLSTADVNQANFSNSAVNLPDGYTAVQENGYIYIVPTVTTYSSWQDVKTNAVTSTAMQHTAPTYGYINCSQDGKTIITAMMDADRTVDVYSYDQSTHAVTYLSTITGVINTAQYCPRVAITNDRSVIAWADTTSASKIGLVSDLTVVANIPNAAISGSGTTLAFDENNTLYFANKTNIRKYTYSVSGSTITITETYTLNTYSAIGSAPQCLVDKKNLIVIYMDAGVTTVQNSNGIKSGRIIFVDAKNETISSAFLWYAVTDSGGTMSDTSYYFPIANPVPSVLGTVYTYKFCFPVMKLAFDRSNASLTLAEGTQFGILRTNMRPTSQGSDVYNQQNIPVVYKEDNSFVVFTKIPEALYSSTYVKYFRAETFTEKDQVLGFANTVNNSTIYYFGHPYNVTQIQNGDYEAETTTVNV